MSTKSLARLNEHIFAAFVCVSVAMHFEVAQALKWNVKKGLKLFSVM